MVTAKHTDFVLSPSFCQRRYKMSPNLDGKLLKCARIKQQTKSYQQQHAGALSDGATAAQEADDQQQRSDGDQQVAHVQHVREPSRRVFNLPQERQDGAAVHFHPDADAQDGRTCQLRESDGEEEEEETGCLRWME